MARLDRFYLGECLAERGGMMQIIAGTTFSDHASCVNVSNGQCWTEK